jgi:hypothetical protein
MVCEICGAEVYNVVKHREWHETQEARYVLLDAHSENLIERVYRLEGGDPGVQ